MFMLNERISSYGCTRKVWRARKLPKSSSRRNREQLWLLSALQLPKCIHNSIYAPLKPWANYFITERQQGSARRSLLLKILTTHKKKKIKQNNEEIKVNKRPYWLIKNTPHLILWFKREHLIHLTHNCEWKAQNLRGKGRKSKPNELKCH